ncbi:hypothetical protein Nepgr_021019 [Nepenthes gracilis]|uniref:Uncharacterized protein n=1 Tax=Nepenthes gracilis TaxID=150966 RepID=A0AAD3SX91_NEPGR|nr:hypothetical protein Nepgr_021019 [Nepenthes gracilis]
MVAGRHRPAIRSTGKMPKLPRQPNLQEKGSNSRFTISASSRTTKESTLVNPTGGKKARTTHTHTTLARPRNAHPEVSQRKELRRPHLRFNHDNITSRNRNFSSKSPTQHPMSNEDEPKTGQAIESAPEGERIRIAIRR